MQAYTGVSDCGLILSDEVEARVLLFEARVDNRGCPTFASPLTDECSQPVGVANARWFFDRSRHIVVGVAQLIGKQLNLVWTFTDIIVKDCELGWSSHTLLGSNGAQIEFVGVLVNNCGVDDSSSSGVGESANLASENSGVHALTSVDVHEFGIDTGRLESSSDLLNLRNTDSLYLSLTDTVTIEEDAGREGSVILFESGKSISHSSLEVV